MLGFGTRAPLGGDHVSITYLNSRLDPITAGEQHGMSTTRDRSRALSRLRPLAVALTLSGTSAGLHAVTLVRPGDMQSTDGALREDGTRLRTRCARGTGRAAARWARSPDTTHRYVTSCADDGPGSLRAVIAASASGDTVDLGELSCASDHAGNRRDRGADRQRDPGGPRYRAHSRSTATIATAFFCTTATAASSCAI